MTAPTLHGAETADELLWLGFAVAHIAAYRERERLARIDRRNRMALQLVTGARLRGGVVAFL